MRSIARLQPTIVTANVPAASSRDACVEPASCDPGGTMFRDRLRSMLHSLRRAAHRPPPVDRSTALEDELQFWREWFKTGGLEWPWEFRDRLDPQLPIQPYVRAFIDRLPTERVR